MLRALLFLLFFFLLARAVMRLLGGIARGASSGPARGPGRPASPPAVKMAQCPVCGTYVVPGKAISDVSRGHTLYFCSEACRAKQAG